jgi:hypothetical protein
MIIIRELFDPGSNHWLKIESSSVVMRQDFNQDQKAP